MNDSGDMMEQPDQLDSVTEREFLELPPTREGWPSQLGTKVIMTDRPMTSGNLCCKLLNIF